ncbi:MAG: L,D-transpeptidase [Hyphomicrobiaceae bacterium]
MRAGALLAAVAAGLVSVSAASAAEQPVTSESAVEHRPAGGAVPPKAAGVAPEAIVKVAAKSEIEKPAAKTGSGDDKARAASRRAAPSLVVKINLSSQSMSLHYDGKQRETWAISSGREGYPTPRGVFRPQWASKMWYSKKYDDAPMPHSVFFTGGVAVHGTQAIGALGQPASHGCVRLAPGNAARFYTLVHKHGYARTRIEVFGTPPATRVAKRRAPSLVGEAARSTRRPTVSRASPSMSSGYGFGWVSNAQPRQLSRRGNGLYYLPPDSPYRGQESFVYNGVVYRRVR